MRKILFTREDANKIVKEIQDKIERGDAVNIRLDMKGENYRYVLVKDRNEEGVIHTIWFSGFVQGYFKNSNKVSKDSSGVNMPAKVRNQIEDELYEAMQYVVKDINMMGFPAGVELRRAIQDLGQSTVNFYDTAPREYVKLSDIGVEEKVLKAYKNDTDPYFSNGIGIRKADDEIILYNKKKGTKTEILRREINKGDIGEGKFKTILLLFAERLEKVRTKHFEVVLKIVKELKYNKKLNLSEQGLANLLGNVANVLKRANREGSLLEYRVKGLKEYAEGYDEKSFIKYIQPVIVKGRPMMLVKGDLGNIKYKKTLDARSYAMVPYTQSRGVTEIEEGTYVLTLNSFTDLRYNDDFSKLLAYIEFKEGDWDTYFECEGRLYMTLGKALAKQVSETEGKFSRYRYNINKENSNQLGMKNVFFIDEVMGYSTGYELTETHDYLYDMLGEIYELVDKDSRFAYRYEVWLAEYKQRKEIQAASEEDLSVKIAEHKKVNKQLAEVFDENENTYMIEFNKEFGTSYTKATQIKESDIPTGLDSGFVFIEYKDKKKHEQLESLKSELRNRNQEYISLQLEDRIPFMQSLRIKGYLHDRLIRDYNAKFGDTLTVRKVLD